VTRVANCPAVLQIKETGHKSEVGLSLNQFINRANQLKMGLQGGAST